MLSVTPVWDLSSLCFRYMEEVIESTFSLLSFPQQHTSPGTEKALEPAHLLALLDIKATWFKKWMVCFPQQAVVVFCFCFPHTFPPLRLSLAARRLQSDCGSQAPGEEIHVGGEFAPRWSPCSSRSSIHCNSAGIIVPFAEVINRMAPDEPLNLRQHPQSLFTAQPVSEVTSKGV